MFCFCTSIKIIISYPELLRVNVFRCFFAINTKHLVCMGHWWLWMHPLTHGRDSPWPQSHPGPSSSPAVKGRGLQEHLSLCAKEQILLALSGIHASHAQKELFQFLCNHNTSQVQGSSIPAAADMWELQVGLVELQGWVLCRSRGTGLAHVLASLTLPGPVLWVIFLQWHNFSRK